MDLRGKFPDVSLETKRVFRFRAGNPAGANGVLMGTLRQRGMKKVGENWKTTEMIIDNPRSFFVNLAGFLVKLVFLEVVLSLWQPFYSEKWLL